MPLKKSKWRKWQIGAVATLGVAFLFREVQTSPQFAEAVAKESGSAGDTASLQKHDPVTEELRGGASGSAGTGQSPGIGKGRGIERSDSGSSGSGGSSSSGSSSGSYGSGGSGQTVQPQPTQAPSTRMQARTRRS